MCIRDSPVIRMKLAHMARQIEASYNWLENLVYQCQKMGETEAMLRLSLIHISEPTRRSIKSRIASSA